MGWVTAAAQEATAEPEMVSWVERAMAMATATVVAAAMVMERLAEAVAPATAMLADTAVAVRVEKATRWPEAMVLLLTAREKAPQTWTLLAAKIVASRGCPQGKLWMAS